MEPSKDPLSVRISRLNSEILGKCSKSQSSRLVARETLLDSLLTLYEECSLENLQKTDPNVRNFFEKYQKEIKELKQLRINMSDFEIKNVIGRGHFGEVHLVKERQTGDLYAMKTLRKFDKDLSHLSFEEERNIMAYADSPWLTSLQYAFQDSTYLFFIMEYHPGGDLYGLLSRQGGTLPESAAVFYIAEMVLALEDLHKMGYIHRDIKPENVLLDRCGHLKLADFGSAAKLNENGVVTTGPPVGTPDYVAPEVLQFLEKKDGKSGGYGASCDFWSLGVLSYELIVGNTPFTGLSSASVYSKIFNHSKTLNFPSDITLSQAFVNFVRGLITEDKSRLTLKQIKRHDLFKNIQFEHLRDQVPPYVPKIKSMEDISNFLDIPSKKKHPTIDNFKKRSQFSGRNLPFIGFTYTPDDNFEKKYLAKNEIVEDLKSEVAKLRKEVVKRENFSQERGSLEKKLEENGSKLETLENLRDKLERDLATTMAENTALKRTLDLERKDRSELEKKALDLIKSAKIKWEMAEKNKVQTLTLEIEQQKEKIIQLTTTNNMLNNQLQHALNMEMKHKESLDKVEDLSRRSVVGLESRLEKISNETHSAIADLQKKLSDEKQQKMILENKCTKLKDREADLLRKLEESEQKFDVWKTQIDEAQNVIKILNEQITILERDVEKISEYKDEIKNLQDIIDGKQKAVKELENRNTCLQMETKMIESYKQEIIQLKLKISKLEENDKKIIRLESELLEEKKKSDALQKQLQDSENALTDSQELKECRLKYWKIEKELSNCQIDKRILERELKDTNEEIKQLKQQIKDYDKKLNDNKQIHESALLELNSINEAITMELVKTKESYKNLQDMIQMNKQKNEEEKLIVIELKNLIKSKDDKIKSLHTELNALKRNNETLELEIKKTKAEKEDIQEILKNTQKEKNDLHNDWDKAKRQIENLNLNLHALREACTLLENQVIEYEKIKDSLEAKCSQINVNTEKLIQDLCDAKQEIQEAKKQTNEEKSLKLMAEAKIRRLNDEMEILREESRSYQNQCEEYKTYSSEIAEELNLAEEKIINMEVTIKSFQRQIDDLRSEMRVVKQENSNYLTELNQVKESCYKMKTHIKELKEEKYTLMQQLNELEAILNEKNNYYKEREMKSDATIKQHIKLIDYLQSKIDELSNKKRTLTEVLFGNSKKENQPPPSLALNYKELESQLLKEKQNNRYLQEEIYKLKAATAVQYNKSTADKLNKVERHKSEIVSPKTKIALEQIVNSPSKQKDLYRQPSTQRMHHNIPHRFETWLCTKPTRCSGCSESIPLGRSAYQCSECNATTHTACIKKVPNTCGLPQTYAKHYKDSLERNKTDVVMLKCDNGFNNVEGWIKLPGKPNGWEKRYAYLTSDTLNIYSEPPTEKSIPLQKFVLKPENSHGRVIVEPPSSELPVPVANNDLPFIIKIEIFPDTTCWPPKSFYFMTLSVQEKEKWFSALKSIYYEDQDKPKLENILLLPENLEVNTIVELTESIKVLGTSKGLYTFYEKDLLPLDGFNEVHHISIMKTTGAVLMIVNEMRNLVAFDLNHLINSCQCARCVKPTIKFTKVNVNSLNNFHILEVSQYSKQQKVCVATSKQLIILNYDLEKNLFVPISIIDTAQPTSCLLFTENTLLVGTDKFFEIDLANFEAEEFLDISDIRLRHVQKCPKVGSFPIAILQISKTPREYLLCFNEFSVFVDEYGRSTRNSEIKWNHLPLAFHFAKPYLYVLHFSTIEIIKINDDTCNAKKEDVTSLDSIKIELEKFAYVGYNSRGIYVSCDREIKYLDAKKIVDDDLCSTVSETTENDSDRFSFSSSIMQSLDGNISDTESVEEKTRRVKFSSETDL